MSRRAGGVTGRKTLDFGTNSAHLAGGGAGRIRTYVRHIGGDGRSGPGAAARGASSGAALARARRRRVCQQQRHARSCARPTTRRIGARQGARPARSGWRRSPAATTAPRCASRVPAMRCASLPALDHALSTGELTLDQVAAAAEFATPESDAELARVALGKAPSAIAPAARSLAPPKVEDDQALYERRSLSMTWTRGRRELAQWTATAGAGRRLRAGHLEHRQERALDKHAGTTSSGSSTPRMHSSPSPRRPAAQTAAQGAAPPP